MNATPKRIMSGLVGLEQRDQRMYIVHETLRTPIEIEPKRFERWLLRILRESVFAPDQPPTHSSGDD